MYDYSLHNVHTHATDQIWENKIQHTQNDRYIFKYKNRGKGNERAGKKTGHKVMFLNCLHIARHF